jgi:non-specific serine/threonine protein kinase
MPARWRRSGVVASGVCLLALVSGCDTSPPATGPTAAASSSAEPTAPGARSAAGLAWRRLSPAPSQRTEVTGAYAGGRIYLIGGYRGDGATVATVEVLEVATGRWSTGPALPIAVNHAMAATVNDTVYLFGGYTANAAASAAAFRLGTGGWQRIADLPEGRAAGTAVGLHGHVYVAGGIGPGGKLASRMLVYDAAENRWTTAPGPPTQREHLGGAGYRGIVYTVGGRTGAGNLAAFEQGLRAALRG